VRSLQEEIKKRQPFAVAEQEAALNLARTCDAQHADLARLVKAHGLTGPQYNVLRILRGAAEPLCGLEIASRMITQLPDITRLLDRLEAAGLVDRSRTEADRRVVLNGITAPGLARLAALDEPILEAHRRHFGHLTRAELRELNRLLVKARNPGKSGV